MTLLTRALGLLLYANQRSEFAFADT